jgi:hypothetical protein
MIELVSNKRPRKHESRRLSGFFLEEIATSRDQEQPSRGCGEAFQWLLQATTLGRREPEHLYTASKSHEVVRVKEGDK